MPSSTTTIFSKSSRKPASSSAPRFFPVSKKSSTRTECLTICGTRPKKWGYFGYAIPHEWGGLGLDLAQDVELAMELGYTSLALRSMFGTNNLSTFAVVSCVGCDGTTQVPALGLPVARSCRKYCCGPAAYRRLILKRSLRKNAPGLRPGVHLSGHFSSYPKGRPPCCPPHLRKHPCRPGDEPHAPLPRPISGSHHAPSTT